MKQKTGKKGKLVIVSGPSGVGKSTICKELVKADGDICLSVSVTTRPRSKTETNGVDYWFVSEDEFQQRLSKGLMLEHARVFGNLYGTPKDKVEELLRSGKIVILEIDVQGAKQVKSIFPDVIMIFIMPPSEKTLSERLDLRAREAAEEAKKRLNVASTEIAVAKQLYKHKVVNDDLQQAIKECLKIINEN
jgi:guanylate kinase